MFGIVWRAVVAVLADTPPGNARPNAKPISQQVESPNVTLQAGALVLLLGFCAVPTASIPDARTPVYELLIEFVNAAMPLSVTTTLFAPEAGFLRYQISPSCVAPS